MLFYLRYLFLVPGILLLVGCSPATVTSPAPTAVMTEAVDDFYQSRGSGEPRTIGYWLLWNSCAPDNKAETARANGGRETGWFLLDDLLEDPGILLGELPVATCEQAIGLLQRQDLDGAERDNDPAYQLAAQLLAAQVNLAVGAEYCPAVEQAVQGGQLLLLSLDFNGKGGYVGTPVAIQELEMANMLIDQLKEYNAGQLCK